MLSWVVKVVPQLPETPAKNTEDQDQRKPDAALPPTAAPPPVCEKKVTFEDECKHEERSKQDVQTASGNGPASSMLMRISNTLPHPAVQADLNRASSTSKEETAAASKSEDEKGMIAWISQGLEKVVPQPELKSKESSAAEQQVQVHQTAAPPESQFTAKDVDETDKTSAPSMMDWIKHGIVKVIPQPEIPSKTDGKNRTEAPATITAPPPACKSVPETQSMKEPEQQPNVMGWIVSGLGRMLPQPVPKPDAGGDEEHDICIVSKKMDRLDEGMAEGQIQDTKLEKREEQTKETHQLSKKGVDNAETEVDHLTPLMDSIKKGAEEMVLTHIEERLQQERLEAARVAEEMARKAAEEAVRQLEIKQSAKIIIETLPESNEQLPNILEEENEDDPECLLDVCQAEDLAEVTTQRNKAESAPLTEEHLALSTARKQVEQVTPSSTDVEPASDTRDLESPVTQQPAEAVPITTEQTRAAATEEAAGSAVLNICTAVEGFLLQFPLAASCLKSCRKLWHERDFTPPTLSTPTPPPELTQLTQQLFQACQRCMSIASRFTRLNSQNPRQL